VVDTNGRLLGVLSSTDFVHWAERGSSRNALKDCVCSSWQLVDSDALPREEVRQFMTPDPVTVAPATRIADLARKMLDAHIHRLIVVDGDNRPIGIVSSTDVLAAVAYTAAID
jgi:CBS domain-containing protein